MPATSEQLFAFFDELGITHSTVEHPPLFTVEDGRDLWHKIPGLHCKNLFLKDKKDKVWLVVMPGDKRADLKQLGKQLGCGTLSFGKPELLMEVMGLTPGSVSPFGLINDTQKRIAVVIDNEVAAAEYVNFHPLRNTASTTIRAADLIRFIKALGYDPLTVTGEKSF